MASKFQNRLAGTIALVALVVIVLPAILDGHKKHYQEDFAAIPLQPKPDDQRDLAVLPPVSQPLPAQPPEGAGAEIQAGNAAAPSLDTVRQAANSGFANTLPPEVTAPPAAEKPLNHPGKNTNASTEKPAPPPDPASSHTERENILALFAGNTADQQNSTDRRQQATPKADTPPVGRAWVVQLGALKNADKVNSIVEKLRTAGYRVYTQPSTPVAGQITRILVGPETSKEKLSAALTDLNRISGLTGVVKSYVVQE